MELRSFVVTLIALLRAASAAQPSAPSPVPAPLRDLPWGQLNFLHTTDTHGWHGGHLQEPQYSADWGDYISFAQHLRDKADADGSDLLLVDTGDRVEGNGLYDASTPKGEYTFDIIKEQKIDIITSGNHELYLQNTSNNEYYKTVLDFKDSYIASNLDIYNPTTGKLEPLAPRYKKFTTKNQGIRIIAFGFLFDFHGNANNTVVQPVEETIKEKWFTDAIRDRDVDLFVVAGHVACRDSPEYTAIFKAIRNIQWDTPIQFFGGHTHIRDYVKYDKRAYCFESGRYMETLGFQSISGLEAGGKAAITAGPTYGRRYIDNNLFSMHHHTGLNETTFPTEHGRNVSMAIFKARRALRLDKTYGCAPKTYWLNRAPYPAEDSLLTWLEKDVLPSIGSNMSSSITGSQVFITNSGAMRFDIFKGAFTIDTTFLVSPFTSGFRKIPGVPYKTANQILGLLNNQGPITISQLMHHSHGHLDLTDFESGRGLHMLSQLAPPNPPITWPEPEEAVVPRYLDRAQNVLFNGATTFMNKNTEKMTPGYTTKDDAGSDGDDTLHERIQFYDVPNCIGTNINIDQGNPPDKVDLVYNEFIEQWILLALRYLGLKYEKKDTAEMFDGRSFTTLMSEWVADNWKCE